MNIRLVAVMVALGFVSSGYAGGPYDNPVSLFAEAYLPALTHFEKAKIETTLRGFILRADTHPGFRDEDEASEAGICLNVAVRDAEEIPRFTDKQTTKGEITTRTVDFPPATPSEEVGLRVHVVYGSGANRETLSAIDKCIREIRKRTASE